MAAAVRVKHTGRSFMRPRQGPGSYGPRQSDVEKLLSTKGSGKPHRVTMVNKKRYRSVKLKRQ